MSDTLIECLRNWETVYEEDYEKPEGSLYLEAANRIEELEYEVKTLRKGLRIYKRERNRYKHAKPEMTGAYFLAGGYGDKDDNYLPQFVEIVPAYGCGWSQIYEKTDRTIMYEGS